MKKIFILLYLSFNALFLCAQTVLSIEGTTINNSEPASWNGVNIPRSVPTTFTYRNNSITAVNAYGYMLQAGDEGVSLTKNNLVGEVITGNVFTWNGTSGNSITHGVFTGYNNNAVIKYNFLHKVPMGIIRKSNGMTDTAGGVAYNIVKDGFVAVNIKGMNGICVYNNTFYSTKTKAETYRGIVHIYSNDKPIAASTGTKIKNNIFYTAHQISNITIEDVACVPGFESDYNLFWCEEGTPVFDYLGQTITFAAWQARGFDLHSVVINPDFLDANNFNPRARLGYGINLGAAWQSGLSTNAFWSIKDPDTANQNGIWQTGARVYRFNQSPHILNQGFQLNENSPNGTVVGKVVANNPDAGLKIKFSILSGNTNGAFVINDSTGLITVAASAALDFEVSKSFTLIVMMQDNGVGHLNSQAIITITLLDINEPPVISSKTFSVNENSANATIVGTVLATNPEPAQTITYSILSGNKNNALNINSSTGVIQVANSAALNYETDPAFALVVQVRENGADSLRSQAPVNIVLIDVNEPPVISNQAFSVNEHSANGTIVGSVIATNPEPGQTITYAILSGNKNNAFAIHSSTGAIVVANSVVIDYNTDPSFLLVVQVQDNGPDNLSRQASVNIALIDVNEPPVISNQTFSVSENSANGTVVDKVIATDPDAVQTLTFSILSGNEHNAFDINTSTGVITVANSTALDIKVNSFFMLVVNVLDNGIGALSSSANVLITVMNTNDSKFRANKYFIVNEFAPKRTVVGTLAVSRPVAGVFLAYAIISGNTDQAFTVNSSNGSIVVNNQLALNYSINPMFQLTVAVQDSTLGQIPTYVTVNIYVMNTSNAVFDVTDGTQPVAGHNHPYHLLGNPGTGTIITDPSGAIPEGIQFKGDGTGKSDVIPVAADPGLNTVMLNNGNDYMHGAHQIQVSQDNTTSWNGTPDQSVSGMHLFPNPVKNGFLNIKLDDGIREEFELSILDFSGKLMLQKHYENTNAIAVDLSAYPPALYVIYFRSLHFRFSDKLIIL